jgi:hypothetical protein
LNSQYLVGKERWLSVVSYQTSVNSRLTADYADFADSKQPEQPNSYSHKKAQKSQKIKQPK